MTFPYAAAGGMRLASGAVYWNQMPDLYQSMQTGLDSPAVDCAAVNLASTDAVAPWTPRGVYVGVSGDLKVDLGVDGTAVTFTAVAAGGILPIRASKIYKVGTTATNLVWVQ